MSGKKRLNVLSDKRKEEHGCEKREDTQQHVPSAHLCCARSGKSQVGNESSV